MKNEDKTILCENPILKGDFPDPDVIRVGDTYYMVSTTMHFMPGAVILQSFDLVHWEIISHIYDVLEETDGYRLENGKDAYGQGMWAPCLRYANGTFYVNFSVNDIHKSVLYQAKDIKGPWKKSYIDGFYYDSSLLFDDDGRVYIVHGNRHIWLTELTADLSGPKPGGLNRNIINDTEEIGLGYEGAHIYKINGKYYVFLIHWPSVRAEACFVADSLEGEFVGRDVVTDDMGYHEQGVAQGGIVDTPEGDWYGVLFQDYGAVGRIPVLVPMHWENDFPVFGENGKVPKTFTVKSTRPDYEYVSLYDDDDFKNGINPNWEWNHNPVNSLFRTGKEGLTMTTDRVVKSMTWSVNTLTRRLKFPKCAVEITVDGTHMKKGDYAGLCALQSCYAQIAITKDEAGYALVMAGREPEGEAVAPMKAETLPAVEYARVQTESPVVRFRLEADFSDMLDEVSFFYEKDGSFVKLGQEKKMYFKLDHFTGCRGGLFYFSTEEKGGRVSFKNFTFC